MHEEDKLMTSRNGHGQTNKEDHQAIWQAPSGDKSSLWYNLPKLCTDVVVTATHSQSLSDEPLGNNGRGHAIGLGLVAPKHGSHIPQNTSKGPQRETREELPCTKCVPCVAPAGFTPCRLGST